VYYGIKIDWGVMPRADDRSGSRDSS